MNSCLNCKWAKWDAKKTRGMQFGKCAAAGSLASYKARISELMPYEDCPTFQPKAEAPHEG